MREGQGGELKAPTAIPEPAPPGTSVDIEEFARNLARVVEEGGKALAAYLKPRARKGASRANMPSSSMW
jgi:hypothetical protein